MWILLILCYDSRSPLQWNSKWLSGEESACWCRRHKRFGFNPWVAKIPWRRTWQPTAVFLPGKSHGQRSLVGYSPYNCKESDTTEWLNSNNDNKSKKWKRTHELTVAQSGVEWAGARAERGPVQTWNVQPLGDAGWPRGSPVAGLQLMVTQHKISSWLEDWWGKPLEKGDAEELKLKTTSLGSELLIIQETNLASLL